MLWKLSNYRVPGDGAEDAAAAFLRTAWLAECTGNPAPDEMWEHAQTGDSGLRTPGPEP